MKPTSSLTVVMLSVLVAACGEDRFPNVDELDKLNSLWGLPKRAPADSSNKYLHNADAAALGKRFFEDKGFSGCGDVSCATCHEGAGFSYHEATAPGCGGRRGTRNPPSLLNVAHSEWFMWDGRADRLWSQAVLPLLDPSEMNGTVAGVRARMTAVYTAEYSTLFGKAPTEEEDDRLLANFGKAVAAYEATLVSVDAPFDRDLQRFINAAHAGDAESDPTWLGLKVFVRKGNCMLCHKGPQLSDQLFHNIGLKDEGGTAGRLQGALDVAASRFRADGAYSDAPEAFTARFQRLAALTQKEVDESEGAFKTPTLRNLTLSAPYMHTGGLATLEEVVEFYDRGGDDAGTFRGTRAETVHRLDLSDAEKRALLELLQSMSQE